MHVNNMRELVADVYKGESWQKKVDKMSDEQIIAIYYKFLKQGKFEESAKSVHDTVGEALTKGLADGIADPKPFPFGEPTKGDQISFADEFIWGGEYNAVP
jgi:hypothetical protein